MDHQRFDQFTRFLARETNRRNLLVAALSAVAGTLGIRKTSAQCLEPGAFCTEFDACCYGLYLL